jgi:hypothetical protein
MLRGRSNSGNQRAWPDANCVRADGIDWLNSGYGGVGESPNDDATNGRQPISAIRVQQQRGSAKGTHARESDSGGSQRNG